MKLLFLFFAISFFASCSLSKKSQKIFDVHLHGSKDIPGQVHELEQGGVYKVAISTSWELQDNYKSNSKIKFLYGLMFPCPNGKVPYSLQSCFSEVKDWPSPDWVEQQIKDGKIDFLGEVLSQYYGISSSDSLLFPYYALAVKYNLPVGIHTGGAGPDHGSPNFKMELGNPKLLENMLLKFPTMKVWIMHGGDQYFFEAIEIMQKNSQVYADISVISNPNIVPSARFNSIMKAFVDAGLGDRLMFGTDNGNIEKVIAAVGDLGFLTKEQKAKIFYKNAEHFFSTGKKGK